MKTLPHISLSDLKTLQKLTQKKYRRSDQKFLIEGTHLVEEALTSDWNVETILVSLDFQKKLQGENIIRLAETKGISVLSESERDIEKLSDTVTAQGIIGVVAMKEYLVTQLWKSLPQPALFVALDDVADPGNVGTILRTCDWFGVDAVLLNKNTVELFNTKVVRASMGALFHLPILYDVDLLELLDEAKKNEFKIITTAVDGGQPLPLKSVPQKCIIVLGNEAHGVSKEIASVADGMITIARFGKAESLNVAITCGIVLGMLRLGG